MTIIKTMKLLKNYIFVKVGDPISKKNRNKNIELIKKLNLEKKVYLLNKVSTQKIYNLIFSSDVYIAPSYSEGFGRTTIEAQILNKKIICSNIPINKEILGNTATYVKKLYNPHAWYKSILNEKNKKINIYLKKIIIGFYLQKILINISNFLIK